MSSAGAGTEQIERTTITVPEIAKRIGRCEPKVRAMLRDGVIPNVRHGRVFIVSRAAFERWTQNIGEQHKIVGLCPSTNVN